MSVAATFELEIDKMDMKTTFPYGDLEEETYMKHPEGFTIKGKEELVCRLKKCLYGLKQSPRVRYQKFDPYIQDLGFKRSQVDHCLYNKKVREHFIYVALYVDDMLLVGNNMDMIKEVKQQLSCKFNMKDLRPTHFIIGIKIKKDRANKRLWLSQKNALKVF